MFKWLKREKIKPIFTLPGDKLLLLDGDRKLLEAELTKTTIVDEVGIFEFENEFGQRQGFGGIFGEAED